MIEQCIGCNNWQVNKGGIPMAKGWKGANPAGMLYDITDPQHQCTFCEKREDLRIFHSLEPKLACGHILVCKEHAEILSNTWHGCGCGG